MFRGFTDMFVFVSTPTHMQYYTNDAFGLQTLDKAGKIHIHEISGVEHVHWHGNKTVFDCCIKPYLN